MRTVYDYLGGPLAQPRLSALLLSGFGLVALLLAAIGLYGMMATVVRERTRGSASAWRLVRAGTDQARVLSRALTLRQRVLWFACQAAVVASRFITSQLLRGESCGPVALLSACLLLLAVALLAAYLPAQRGTRIEPASALQAD